MGGKGRDVVVVGSLHLDIVVEAQSLPRLDETARGSAWRMVCGGKGGNQACWAARLGAPTAMLGQVGDDDFGRRLLENLKACGVDSDGIVVNGGQGSGMSVAILNSDGEYGAVIVSGANLAIDAAHVRQALQQGPAPKLVMLQNEIEEAINLEAARAGRSLGARILLNAAPARPLPPDLAALVDILVVNRVEAEMMAGAPVENAEAALRLAPKLAPAGGSAIITLGGQGLVVVEQGRTPEWLAAQPVKLVSAHGAGDCFIGQLAASLASGADLGDAARTANSTAARYVSGKL